MNIDSALELQQIKVCFKPRENHQTVISSILSSSSCCSSRDKTTSLEDEEPLNRDTTNTNEEASNRSGEVTTEDPTNVERAISPEIISSGKASETDSDIDIPLSIKDKGKGKAIEFVNPSDIPSTSNKKVHFSEEVEVIRLSI